MSSRVLAVRFRNVFYVDVPATVAGAIIFIWIASFADYFLTVFQVARGGLELNPILAHFFHNLEYEKAFFVKTALTFPGICILSVFYRYSIAVKATFAILLVYVCLLVYHALNIFL